MAGGIHIKLGRAFVYSDTRIVFKGRGRNAGQSYLFEDADGIQVRFDADEIVRLRETNELRDWVAPSGTDMVGHGANLPMQVAAESDKQAAERKLAYCMAWAAAPGTPRSPRALRPIIQHAHANRRVAAEHAKRYEPPPPSVSSVQKWLATWLGQGETGCALLPRHRLKGNRRCKLAPILAELVADAVDEHYLTSNRLSVAEVHRRLEKQIKALNERAKPGEKLQAPSYDAVRAAVGNLCQYTVDFHRLGKAAAAVKWRPRTAGLFTTRANEVWEIDDTRVDLICTAEDGETVVGRPWVILIIDRHTRMLMGFDISFSPPDTTAVLNTLKMAMLTKDAYLAAMGIRGSWPANNRPDTIHVDKGRQYNSKALTRALATLGIDHRTMPVLKAWFKGTIERAIGTMSRQVFHLVPGTTFANIFERDEAPELVAKTTISDLRAKLATWIVQDYQHRLHKGIEAKPHTMWVRSVAAHGLRMPLSRETLDDALSLTIARVGRKDGLQFHKLRYMSKDLMRVLMLPKRNKVEELIIRIDRENLETVEFYDASTSAWYSAYLLADLVPRVRGRTLDEYLVASAMHRAQGEESISDPHLQNTYAAMDEIKAKQAASPKLRDRSKAERGKERALTKIDRLTRPEPAPMFGDEDDLTATIDKAAREHLSEAPQEPVSGSVTDAGPSTSGASTPGAWAKERGLGVRTRKPTKKE